MSNVETQPQETVCPTTPPADGVELLEPRDVPLGGPRAMTVRRTLPQRQRSLIGAWCFADHYGPDDVAASGGMDVPPHPHTGLQTVSWLFTGEIEHRDSLGSHALVRPGAVNLMTGGLGIAHSEVSTPGTTVLHGAQLWVALPEAHRNAPKDFQHHEPTPTRLDGATLSVFLGTLAGQTSPVDTFTPLLGAEVDRRPGRELSSWVSTRHTSTGCWPTAKGSPSTARPPRAAPWPTSPPTPRRSCWPTPRDEPARALLLGGPPFGEEIVMWWNFVGRSHEDIVAARDEWMAHSARFGEVEGYAGDVQHLPAPVMPAVRIRPRGNAARSTRDS